MTTRWTIRIETAEALALPSGEPALCIATPCVADGVVVVHIRSRATWPADAALTFDEALAHELAHMASVIGSYL